MIPDRIDRCRHGRSWAVAGVAVFVLAGCRSAPPRLTPIAGHTGHFVWRGEEFAVATAAGSEVILGVAPAAGGYAVTVACRNLSSAAVNVGPEDLGVQAAYDSPSGTATLHVCEPGERSGPPGAADAMARLAVALGGTTLVTSGPGAGVGAAGVGAPYRPGPAGRLERTPLAPGEGVLGIVLVERARGGRLPSRLRFTLVVGRDRHEVVFARPAETDD